MDTWEEQEKTCAQAREALSGFPARGRPEYRQELQREYKVALEALQDYLTRRYGWGPGPTIQ
ncbi:MAG: hypothetical protein ABIG98_01070 [Chloroflexota bacterium]